MSRRETFLKHLNLSGRHHSWHLHLQRPCLLLITAPSEFSPTNFSQNDDSDSSVDTTRENSIYLRNFRTTVTPEGQQAQSSSEILPKSYDLRPRLPPRDYHEKVVQNKIPPKTRCVPISGPASTQNQLTQSQKRDAVLDSCQRRRTLQRNSVT